MNTEQILNDLKKEVDSTLIFFCQMDMQIHGYITGDTVECFKVQNRVFPKVLESLTNPNHNYILTHLSN